MAKQCISKNHNSEKYCIESQIIKNVKQDCLIWKAGLSCDIRDTGCVLFPFKIYNILFLKIELLTNHIVPNNWCDGLDLECPPKVHVLKVWSSVNEPGPQWMERRGKLLEVRSYWKMCVTRYVPLKNVFCPLPLFHLLYSGPIILQEVFCFAPPLASHHYILPQCGHWSNNAKWIWTDATQTVSQNNSFFL